MRAGTAWGKVGDRLGIALQYGMVATDGDRTGIVKWLSHGWLSFPSQVYRRKNLRIVL